MAVMEGMGGNFLLEIGGQEWGGGGGLVFNGGWGIF